MIHQKNWDYIYEKKNYGRKNPTPPKKYENADLRVLGALGSKGSRSPFRQLPPLDAVSSKGSRAPFLRSHWDQEAGQLPPLDPTGLKGLDSSIPFIPVGSRGSIGERCFCSKAKLLKFEKEKYCGLVVYFFHPDYFLHN